MIDRTLLRLHTRKLSPLRLAAFGKNWIELIVKSIELAVVANVFEHSPVFKFQILIVPSDEQDTIEWPSGEYSAPLTNEVCPLNSFNNLPDFSP